MKTHIILLAGLALGTIATQAAEPTVQTPTVQNLRLDRAEPEVRRARPIVRGLVTDPIGLATNREKLTSMYFVGSITKMAEYSEEQRNKMLRLMFDEAFDRWLRAGSRFEIIDSFTIEENYFTKEITFFFVRSSSGIEGWAASSALEENAKVLD